MKKVINFPTKEQFKKALAKIELEHPEARWAAGEKPTEGGDYWNTYKERTCINISLLSALSYRSKKYFEEEGYEIIPANKYLGKKEFEDLKVGDMVIDGYGDKHMVLAVYGLLTCLSEDEEGEDVLDWHTKKEFEDNFTIPQEDDEEEVEELTMEEVCKELGRTIKIKE